MRQNYIDALRGLAIFVVVYCHFVGFKLNLTFSSYIMTFLTSFFIPLFFFISGYCVYKSHIPRNFLYNKSKTLLLPTIIILLISSYIWNSNFLEIIQLPGTKGGYWFTFILFQMMIFYGLIKSIKIENFIKNKILVESVYIIYFIFIILLYRLSFDTLIGNIMSSSMLFYNLIYFVIGLYCKKYKEIFHRIIDNKFFLFFIFFLITI